VRETALFPPMQTDREVETSWTCAQYDAVLSYLSLPPKSEPTSKRTPAPAVKPTSSRTISL